MKHIEKAWMDRSPQERDEIALNRSLASYRNPFNGKNGAQRRALHVGFNQMASRIQKLGWNS